MEESQSKLHRSQRLKSQPNLCPKSKLIRTKRTCLTGSKSPGKFGTRVPTPAKTLVTLNIPGNLALIEEIQQPPKDGRTDPSVRVSTSISELATLTTDSEGVIPQTSIAADFVPSSALEIFYGPDGLPLPPGLIAIEEIVEDPQSNTPSQFGVEIALYPSSSEISLLLSEAPVESLGNLLDRLEIFDQPSTSRTVSSNTVTAELPSITPTMFADIPSIPTSSQSLQEAHLGAILTVWFIPVYSSGIVSRNSNVGSQQIDPSGCQFGSSVLKDKQFL